MENELWDRFFKLISHIQRNISFSIQQTCSIQELRTFKTKLYVESPQIYEIYLVLETIASNIDSTQQHKFDLACEAFRAIDNKVDEVYETINRGITQHNINSAILFSINVFRKKIQPLYNKINKNLDRFAKIFVNTNNLDLIKKFDFIDSHLTDKINSECKVTQVLISKKFNLAKNSNQIRKILFEIKSFINEEIERVSKIYLSGLSKVKILFKSLGLKFKKPVILNEKDQIDNECSTKLNKKYLSDIEFPVKIKKYVNMSIIVKSETSLKLNYKYRKKAYIQH